MGTDLMLLPFRAGRDFSHSVVEFSREYALFDEIHKLVEKFGQHTPLNFTCHVAFREDLQEYGYGKIQEDRYGTRLEYIPAKEMRNLNSDDPVNNAILQYIRALPDDWNVALLWC